MSVLTAGDLQAAIERDLPVLRAAANARMTSTVVIGALVDGPMDPDTLEIPKVVSPAYTGRARIPPVKVQERAPVVGQVEHTVKRRLVHVPWDTTGLLEGMVVEVSSSRTPGLVGRRFTVVEVPDGDDQTALRLQCEEVARGD